MPFRLSIVLPVCLIVGQASNASAQTVHVGSESALRSAISSAAAGSTIVLDTNISLSADLPSVASSVTIDGAGHTLSGANQYRGLFIAGFDAVQNPAPINVTVQNLTIANTVAAGGTGGDGSGGGGGGAGLGGAIFVGNSAAVTVTNVSVVSSSAIGGNGGNGNGDTSGGGGGGLGGNGGSALGSGAGGGGVGRGADGGTEFTGNGGAGILTGAAPGGDISVNSPGTGGVNGGGGGGGGFGGAGGGNQGQTAAGNGGSGGFGGGGGGAGPGFSAPTFSGSGGFGGGGGGGDAPGFGGFGAGGGGGTSATTFGGFNNGQFGGAGADGTTANGGGGGAGLGGAIFVATGGTLTFGGGLTIDGSTVTAGKGGAGAADGSAHGSGLYLQGSGVIGFNQAAGQTAAISTDIADERGVIGPCPSIDCAPPGVWGVDKQGAGTLVLTGNNIYTGGTVVEGGTLQINAAQNIGSGGVALMNGTTLDIRGTSTFANGLFLDGTGTVSVAGGQSATWNGLISDATNPGTLAVTGGGTLSVGNTANSFTGGTIVRGNSTLEIGADGALGGAGGGVTLGDAATAGTLRFTSGSAFTTGRSMTLGLGGGVFDTAGTSAITIASSISGGGSLTKTGTGTLTLGAVNTYTGTTDIEQGTLRTSVANAFNSQGLVSVASGATLDLNNFNQSIGALSGAGNVTLGSGTLAAGANGASTLFSGVISGSGGFVKNGAGTLVLTGANTYSGGTTVNAGSLVGTTTSVQGNIANNSLVMFAQDSNGTYGGKMSGTGTLAFAGKGILTLASGNSYSGGTIVAGGGTISIAADSALGAANGGVLLGDSTATGTLSFQNGSIFSSTRSFAFAAGGGIFDTAGNSSITLNGALSGAGGLTKIGTGTLTLGGPASYLGSTSVLSGTLRAAAANVLDPNSALSLSGGTSVDLNGFSQTIGSIAGSGNVALGSGTLTTGGNGADSTFSGSISGSGGLVKAGAGTLTLQGANSYSGGTTVTAGALVGDTTSLQGNILNNSLVVFDQTPNGTYAGSMSGSGTLAKLGAGVLTLTGTNTYTGGTIIDGGSIIGTAASLQGTIVDNGSLTLGGDTDGVFHGLLGGSGGITKTGAGTLTLNGTNPLTGVFTVNQGTLAINGLFGGGVNVGAGATLRATGFIAGPLNLAGSLFVVPPTVASQQLVSSGSSQRLDVPPSLVLGSNLTSTPGSLIDFAIGPGVNPTVQVGGAAVLNGTQFSVTAPSIGTARSASFLAMTAVNGLTMQNADVITPDPTIIPLLKPDKNALFVTVINLNVPLATGITDPNRRGVANAIDRIKFGASGDGATVIHELTALDDQALNDALAQIEGQIHASALQTAVLDADTFTDFARTQAAQAREIGDTGRLHWWTQFNCQHATYKGNSGAEGGSADVCAGAGGADHNFNEHWMAGGGGGFGKGNIGLGGGLGSSDYQAPRAFGYGGWKPKNFGIRFGGSVSRSSYKTDRQIVFQATLPLDLGGEPITGGIDRRAQSTQQGTSSDQWSELHDSRKVRTYTFEGLIGFRHARFSRQGWTETGADSLSLEGQANQSLTLSETDVKISGYRRSGTFRPFFETFYRRELTNAQTATELSFAGATNSNFRIEGLPVPGNTYSGKIGATMMLRFAGQLTAEYSFLTSSAETRQSVGLRFRFK